MGKALLCALMKMAKTSEDYIKRVKRLSRRLPRYNYSVGYPRKAQLSRKRDVQFRYDEIGVEEDLFEEICEKILPHIKRSISALTPRAQIMVTLYWMRNYCSYSTLGRLLGLHRSNVGRIIRKIVLILYDQLEYINFPEEIGEYIFDDTIGAIDCSAHFRLSLYLIFDLFFQIFFQ